MAYPMTKWSSGLCGCCEDTGSCCFGFWCCPCLACSVSKRLGENFYLPLCDIVTPAMVAAFGVPLLPPPATIGIRAIIRSRYSIEGSICKDITAASFCVWCAWCQMDRELKQRMQNNTAVVNMQPTSLKGAPAGPPPDGDVAPSGVILASF